MKVNTYAAIWTGNDETPRWTVHHDEHVIGMGTSQDYIRESILAAKQHGVRVEAFIMWDGHGYALYPFKLEPDGIHSLLQPPLTGTVLSVRVLNDGSTQLSLA